MYKILIYSSQELYDSAGYEGRAEADLIVVTIEKTTFCCFTENFYYEKRYLVKKSKIPAIYRNLTYSPNTLKSLIEAAEKTL